MATIKDVAKAAGVGTGTVSRALSGKGYVDSEKKKQIIKIAEQLEYHNGLIWITYMITYRCKIEQCFLKKQ